MNYTPGRIRKNPPVCRKTAGGCEPVALQLQVRLLHGESNKKAPWNGAVLFGTPMQNYLAQIFEELMRWREILEI